MGVGRKYNVKARTRPKKTPAERARRDKTQRARLVGLGVPEKTVKGMPIDAVKDCLKRPKRTAAAWAKAAE